MPFDLEPILITFKLAGITTLLLLAAGLPLAWWLSVSGFRHRHLVEALVSMPLALPPSVLGFYLLVLFSPRFYPGRFLSEYLNLQLVFSFPGLVVGSVIFSLPFMVQPIRSGLRNLPPSLAEASYSLGKSRIETFFRVLLPGIRHSILAGTVLTFAHTVGEFGVVLMIGGNIPGHTRTASIAIFDEVEALRYGAANRYALILFAITFSMLSAVHYFGRDGEK